jgi:hypothetical protein
MWLIDVKGMDVAQPIWLSGCPIKGHFRVKNAFLAGFTSENENVHSFQSSLTSLYHPIGQATKCLTNHHISTPWKWVTQDSPFSSGTKTSNP